MLLSLRKNGLDSLFKEVRVFKEGQDHELRGPRLQKRAVKMLVRFDLKLLAYPACSYVLHLSPPLFVVSLPGMSCSSGIGTLPHISLCLCIEQKSLKRST